MPRPHPLYKPGSYYYFYNRSCSSRSPIFHHPADFLATLTKIQEVVHDLDLSMIAYCLMPNHYHFLVRQNGVSKAGLLPQLVFADSAMPYNRHYQPSDAIFEGSDKVKKIRQQNYLLHLCRYIHANPVKEKLILQLEDWPYSNYLEWIGKRNELLVDPLFVQQYFGPAAEYRAFVMQYIQTSMLPTRIELFLQDLGV